MERLERVRAFEAENRFLRGGLAAIVEVCKGGDGGGDAPPERENELGVQIVSAGNGVAGPSQLLVRTRR